jgi:hypothetical protein
MSDGPAGSGWGQSISDEALKPNALSFGKIHRQSVFGLASCWLGFCSFLGLFYAVSSSPHDFVFTASDDLLTCSKNVAVKVSFVFVVWKETCK